jgi:hypothetical protein
MGKILERKTIKGLKAWKITDQFGTPYLFTDMEISRARVRAFRLL